MVSVAGQRALQLHRIPTRSITAIAAEWQKPHRHLPQLIIAGASSSPHHASDTIVEHIRVPSSGQALVAAEPGQEALVSRGGGRGLKAPRPRGPMSLLGYETLGAIVSLSRGFLPFVVLMSLLSLFRDSRGAVFVLRLVRSFRIGDRMVPRAVGKGCAI